MKTDPNNPNSWIITNERVKLSSDADIEKEIKAEDLAKKVQEEMKAAKEAEEKHQKEEAVSRLTLLVLDHECVACFASLLRSVKRTFSNNASRRRFSSRHPTLRLSSPALLVRLRCFPVLSSNSALLAAPSNVPELRLDVKDDSSKPLAPSSPSSGQNIELQLPVCLR